MVRCIRYSSEVLTESTRGPEEDTQIARKAYEKMPHVISGLGNAD